MKRYTTSERLKQIMDERNLKQVDILNKSLPYCAKYNVKMNKSDISQYVSGKVEPSQDKLVVLGMALDVTEAWLMGFDVPMNIDTPHNPITTHKGVVINVLGRVAAGVPIEAITDIIDTEEISQELAKTGEFFGLQIHGDSMEPRMYEGDVVIVRKQEDAESGDIVIAMVNGDDATCKRLMKYAGGISLISLNSKYEPMMYTNQEIENKPVRIIGKVVELRGKF